MGWGERERTNLGLNLKSLSFHCSAHFITHPPKKKTMLILFNRVPRICLCIGVKEMLTSPFLHLWPTTAPFHPGKSMCSVKTMIVAFKLCGRLPYAALSKHRAGLMGLASNNNYTVSDVADVPQTSQKAGENKDSICHSQRVCGKKKVRMMKRTLLHRV